MKKTTLSDTLTYLQRRLALMNEASKDDQKSRVAKPAKLKSIDADVDKFIATFDQDDEYDVELFAIKLAKLMDDPVSVLNLQTLILQRAIDYVDKKYGSTPAEELEVVMYEQHGFSLDYSKWKKEAEKFSPPSSGEASGGVAVGT